MYIDQIAGSVDDEGAAKLRSPDLIAYDNEGLCVSFWYYIYGSQVSQLRIFVEQREAVTSTVWIRSMSRDQTWHHGQVNE